MAEILEEIRINSQFSQLTKSVYEKSLKEPSIPRIRKQHIETNTYLKKISNRFNSENILMPPNCRYLEKLSNGGHLVVIEEPPALRTIRTDFGEISNEYEMLKAKGKTEEWGIDKNLYDYEKIIYPVSFTLALPYVIFIKIFDSNNNVLLGQVFFRVARLSGLADYILKTPFTNISDEQHICYGDKNIENRSLDTAISGIIMKFWSSKFNSDYTYNYNAYKKVPYVNTLIEWQYHSQTDPMFIYTVDWLKYECNLHQLIKRIKTEYGFTSTVNFGYKELSSIFVQPIDTGKKEEIGLSTKKKYSLFYDVAQGMYLDSDFFIHVGDPIELKNGKKAFVDSFIGFASSGVISYIQFKTEDGQTFLVKYSNNTSESQPPYLIKAFKKERYAEKGILANGVEIKEDDIIIIDVPATSTNLNEAIYKKVHYVRKSRDGITEAKLGNDFYILENTTGKILDMENPVYDGLALKKGSKYIIITSPSRVPHHKGYHVTFEGMLVDAKKLRFAFKDIYDTRRSPITISYDPKNGTITNSRYRLYEIKNTKIMPPVFRIGRSLLYCKREVDTHMSSKLYENGFAWGTMDGIITERNSLILKADIKQVVENCLLDDGTRLKIESSDFDIEFCIGDKVVAADWENPINTLIIKTIQGFKVDKTSGCVDFILADKNDNLTVVKYIDVRGDAVIFTGRIRHITNKFGKVTSGTKIISKEGFIPNFPKKDVNIIIGFITDSGGEDPLVLCSNGCTLWYSEMIKNFIKITMKSKKWKDLPHVPLDVQKIKIQPGDLINCKGDYKNKAGWLVWSTGSGMHKITNLNTLYKYPDYYHLDTYIMSQSLLDCIPNPRLPKKDLLEKGVVSSIPNFHGLFIQSKGMDFKFINDERSILYVQDSYK